MSKDEGDNSSLNSLSSLTPRNEDESATTTSTESDTFESWTLITEKQRPKKITRDNPIEQKDATNTIDEENMQSIPTKTSTEPDKEVEEFSDGISIISESSESVDRFSPHPLLREQLHNMLPEDPLPTLFTQSSIYSRVEPLDTLDTDEDQQTTKEPLRRRKPSVSVTDSALQQIHENRNDNIISNMLVHPIVKSGFNALFYAVVTLVLLSFWGRLSNPEWNMSGGTSLAEFEQKIKTLEMQQSLMFAEIDLLNKQVKYLTDLSTGKGTAGKFEQKSGKTFKAWSGNGKNLDPVEINKVDLKRAYKCGVDNKFIEIGGVCVDKDTVSPEVLADQVGNVVSDMLQDTETYKSFEKVAEAFLNKGNKAEMLTTPTEATETAGETKYDDYADYAANGNRKQFEGSSKEYKNKFEEQPKKAYFKKHSNERKDDNNYDDDDDSKEQKYEKYNDNSKERYNKQNKYKKSQDNRYNSKERFDKKQRKPSGSEERVDKSKDPYWHEKLMQQREELRRQRTNNNANNWYIERGDSREQARSS